MLILLLSILIISFLYIYIFSNLFIANGNMEYGWRDFRIYRLGDIVLNKDLDNYLNKIFYNIYYRGSIATKYFNQKTKDQDYETLLKITKDKDTYEIPGKKDLVIHLRIGDVLDWEYADSIDDLLSGKNTWHYSKNYNYYEEKLNLVKDKDIEKVILVGGFHTSSDHTRSIYYVKKVKEFIEKKGYEVSTRIGEGNPDQDFAYMVNSNYFLKSGGGYSKLINKLAKLNNAMVLEENDD